MVRPGLGIAAAISVVGGIACGFYVWPRHDTPDGKQTKANAPTLYCEFFNFTHNAVVVSFDFAVARKAEQLAFAQLFVVEPDGTKTDYPDDPPRWRLGADDGTPVLTSPDSETRIVLYGLKPSVAGVFWTEAGVRSNTYRNLEGKCRQAHFDRLDAPR